MAAFVAKQMVGNKLNAVKAESSNKNCLMHLNYVKRILQSGLILDEDLEVLLNVFNSKKIQHLDTNTNSSSFSCSKVTCIFSCTLPSMLAAGVLLKYKKLVGAGILLGVSGIILGIKFRQFYYDRYYETCGQKMIDLIRKLRKLHRGIMQYLKIRKNVALNDLSDDLNLFLNNVAQIEINFIQEIKKDLKLFMDISDISEQDILDLKIESTMENPLKDMLLLDDLLVFYFSKYLCHFALNILNNNPNVIKCFTPKFIKQLDSTINLIESDFNHVKFKSASVNDIKQKVEQNFEAKIAGKLSNTLTDATININLINEKCRYLLSVLETTTEIQSSQLKLISDLRDHTLATYESLDVLCKLYGIISSRKSVEKAQPQGEIISPNPERQPAAVSAHFDDSTEPIADEKYELFIRDDPASVNLNVSESWQNDNLSGNYLNLMLKELKQSLKQHQRFIDAKKRFHSDSSSNGSGDEETEEIPTFQKPSTERNRPVPPPLPPQLPEMSVESFSAPTSVVKSMLRDIKAISGQRSVKEEVFGDDDEDSDSDSSDL